MLCTLASTSSSCRVGFTAGCSLQEQHACCQMILHTHLLAWHSQ